VRLWTLPNHTATWQPGATKQPQSFPSCNLTLVLQTAPAKAQEAKRKRPGGAQDYHPDNSSSINALNTLKRASIQTHGFKNCVKTGFETKKHDRTGSRMLLYSGQHPTQWHQGPQLQKSGQELPSPLHPWSPHCPIPVISPSCSVCFHVTLLSPAQSPVPLHHAGPPCIRTKSHLGAHSK
jgi:hypothetical protein